MSSEQISHGRRAAITTALAAGWSNIDYIAVIGAGEAIDAAGASTPVAASLAAGIGIAETFGSSYLATRGMGDYSYAPKTKFMQHALTTSSDVSPLVSTWRGAPTGVIIDRVNNREVTTKRRLAHSVPYGLALGAWVAVPAKDVASFARTSVEDHPTEVFGAAALVGAAALACAYRKFKK